MTAFDQAWALVKAKCPICGKTHYDGDEMCANCGNLEGDLQESGAYQGYSDKSLAIRPPRGTPSEGAGRPRDARMRNAVENQKFLAEMKSSWKPQRESQRVVGSDNIICTRCRTTAYTRAKHHGRYCCGKRMLGPSRLAEWAILGGL